MQSRHVPMSLDEYHVIHREPGWKYEYFGECLHQTPSHTIVTGRFGLTEKRTPTLPNGVTLQPIQPDMLLALLEPAFDAFHDTIEYCDWEPGKIRQSLHDGLARVLHETKKPLLDASCAAFAGQRLIAAALVSRSQPGPELVLFFVARDWQRQGVGSALLWSATGQLLDSDERDLYVIWHAGNRTSDAFYRAGGFAVVPDLFHAQHMRNVTRANLDSAPHRGVDVDVARQQFEYWRDQVKTLERLADAQGFDAVTAWRDLGW